MEDMLREMIDKGLASLEHRSILARIPLWFACLKKLEDYNPALLLDLKLWVREVRN